MRADLTCECDEPGCDGEPVAHLCETHIDRMYAVVEAAKAWAVAGPPDGGSRRLFAALDALEKGTK